MEKEYVLSVDTMFTVRAKNEDELYAKAKDVLMQMLKDNQVDFMIEEGDDFDDWKILRLYMTYNLYLSTS